MTPETYRPRRANTNTWCLVAAIAANLASLAWAALILTGRVG